MSGTATQFELPELCNQAGVTARTVRYYISRGLLPSPGQTGPGARYGQGHLDRLRLIRRLQREHLPLAEIRRRLEVLDDAQVAALLGDPTASAEPESALDYVRSVLASAAAPEPGSGVSARTGGSRRESAAPTGGAAASVQAASGAARAGTTHDAFPRERAQWERLTLAADVELHVRRPLSRQQNRRVERLVEAARRIFVEYDQD